MTKLRIRMPPDYVINRIQPNNSGQCAALTLEEFNARIAPHMKRMAAEQVNVLAAQSKALDALFPMSPRSRWQRIKDRTSDYLARIRDAWGVLTGRLHVGSDDW